LQPAHSWKELHRFHQVLRPIFACSDLILIHEITGDVGDEPHPGRDKFNRVEDALQSRQYRLHQWRVERVRDVEPPPLDSSEAELAADATPPPPTQPEPYASSRLATPGSPQFAQGILHRKESRLRVERLVDQ